MAYDPGAIDATLAAAVGDDPALVAELREAFLVGVKDAVDALAATDEAPTWQAAAWRLRGLAASFGAVRLMALAGELAAAPPGDAKALRRVRQLAARL